MSGTPVNLRALRCRGERCADPTRLEPHPDRPGWLRCASCGHEMGGGDAFRPYAGTTGSWIIGAAVMLSVGLTRAGSLSRWVLVGVGAVAGAIAVYRLVYQWRTLRALGKPG